METKTAWQLLPDELLDEGGYPTDGWLDFLKNYTPDETLPVQQFVSGVLIDGWHMSDWGFKLGRKYKGKRKLELHTGGWSGNESIIQAVKSNIWLITIHMPLVMWRTGGHYYFEIKVK